VTATAKVFYADDDINLNAFTPAMFRIFYPTNAKRLNQ